MCSLLFEAEQSIGRSAIMFFGGAIGVGVMLLDNLTGVGVANDPLIVAPIACFTGGMDGLLGKKVCSICGATRYGY